MKHRLQPLLFIPMVVLLSAELPAQESGMTISKRFRPYLGMTFNMHFMGGFNKYQDIISPHAFYPGLETGFMVLPEGDRGWRLDYRNNFLPELAMYEIENSWAVPGKGVFEDVVDRTVTNGILGRLDVGRTVSGSEDRSLSAGFVISDKIVLGTQSYGEYFSSGQSYTNTGFHFTPGLFAGYSQVFRNSGLLHIRLAFTQSLFNLHQFSEDAAEDFVLPLFTELDVKYQMKSGLYMNAGALMVTSFKYLPADTRIRVGMGYTFRHEHL